jgi:PAS domain S-box-containing protein
MSNLFGFELLLDNAPVGVIIVEAGGRVVQANRHAAALFGYAAADMTGKEAGKLLPGLFLQSPADIPKGKTRQLKAINSQGQPFAAAATLLPYARDNQAFVAVYITHTGMPSIAEGEAFNNRLEAEVAARTRQLAQTVEELHREIKQVEKKDRELQKMNAFFSSIWNNAGAIIIATDTNGIIDLFNPAAEKYLGYTAGELVGHQTPMLFHDEEEVRYYAAQFSAQLHEPVAPGFETFVAKARRNLPNQHEWTYIPKNGKRFPADVSITALRNEAQKIIGFLGIAFDISDQKMAEVELRTTLQKQKEVNELKSRFVTIASHEFRTPLSTIVSSAYLISQYKKTEEQEKRKVHIDRILSSASMLNDILDDFLSIGKIEEGKIQLRPREFGIEEHVGKIIEVLQGISRHQIRYRHQGPLLLYTDPALLKHIIFNLLSNAIKFSAEGTPIDIKTKIEDGCLQLSVKDRGIGIPEADQQHLFDLFYRASNAVNIQGTGLGLHIIKRYTELLGGQIHFKSKLNEGTEFRIRLHKIVSHEKDLAH